MTLDDRLAALEQLGKHLLSQDEYLDAVAHRTYHENQWFTIENIHLAIRSIARNFLSRPLLEKWIEPYKLADQPQQKRIGLVLAGNIPLVGFHDVLSVFIVGHQAKVKLSEKDKYLLPYLVRLLDQFRPGADRYFEFVNFLKDFDAVIATGSNNSARYFEAYFGKYPHIIRRNRNAVAVLTGSESREELLQLGQDIFQYFGLGCRNVSKLYVPQGYDFKALLESLHEYRELVNHSKYKNNFDYNYALLVMNNVPYMANGCIILKEDPEISSRIAILHYEYYLGPAELDQRLKSHSADIQCIVAAADSSLDFATVPFGRAQQPQLWDYADGVDTLAFLNSLT